MIGTADNVRKYSGNRVLAVKHKCGKRLRMATVDSNIQLSLKVVQTTGRNSKFILHTALHSNIITLYSE